MHSKTFGAATVPEAVRESFDRSRGQWTGCDWPTNFGHSGLDLNGMTSHQAVLMSRATAGAEAADWREAVGWLSLVEADAETAEEAARWAVQHACRGDMASALREAQAAVQLEARYHAVPVWSELLRVIEESEPVGAGQAVHSRP